MTDHLLEAALAALCTDHGETLDRYDVARAVGYIRDYLEAQQADPDPLDETNHADRYDRDGDRWVWCDACDGFADSSHIRHIPETGWSAVAIAVDYGPVTFAPQPPSTATTTPQPEPEPQATPEPARPELNVQTRLANALPVGTVIRADGHAYVHTDAWEWVETVTGAAHSPDELPREYAVIHQPEEPQ